MSRLKVRSFDATRWEKILMWCKQLNQVAPGAITSSQLAVVLLQCGRWEEALELLDGYDPKAL